MLGIRYANRLYVATRRSARNCSSVGRSIRPLLRLQDLNSDPGVACWAWAWSVPCCFGPGRFQQLSAAPRLVARCADGPGQSARGRPLHEGFRAELDARSVLMADFAAKGLKTQRQPQVPCSLSSAFWWQHGL